MKVFSDCFTPRTARMNYPTIVIANDDLIYLKQMNDMFCDAGYRQVYCVSEQEAFRVIREQTPDLILLDINVANQHIGWNMLRLIRLMPATRAIPVLICTTDSYLVHTKGEVLRAQGCSILQKPFDSEQLFNIIIPLVGAPAIPLNSDVVLELRERAVGQV